LYHILDENESKIRMNQDAQVAAQQWVAATGLIHEAARQGDVNT
jgi:hypothetical protein